MASKFPLKMANDTNVRTIVELRENFSLKEVLGYHEDGRLVRWLKDRSMEDIASKIKTLGKSDDDYIDKLCEALGVSVESDKSFQEVKIRTQKLATLRKLTNDKQILDNMDSVAMQQNEITELLNKGVVVKIYLCGAEFNIPLDKGNITYVGIGDVIAKIPSNKYIDFDKLNIKFENIKFDQKYTDVLNKEAERQFEINSDGCLSKLLFSDSNKKIVIPYSVTSIGEAAFKGYTRLTEIIIPNSVDDIGSSAFYGCTGLKAVTISNSVTTISSNAFDSCSSLQKVSIPDSVTTINPKAFYNCSSLITVNIPDSVTQISNGAFRDCARLKEVIIPNSVNDISNSVFYGCKGLTEVIIPDLVTSIGKSAFQNCTGLTKVTIPDSVTSIGRNAFSGCTKLTQVEILNSNCSYSDVFPPHTTITIG